MAKTLPTLLGIGAVGALAAWFFTKKSSAASGTESWCAGVTQGICLGAAPSPTAQAAANQFFMDNSPGGVPAGVTFGLIDPGATGGQQTWGVFQGGKTIQVFYVWRLS